MTTVKILVTLYPSFNNLDYLKLCIKVLKNSHYDHQIVHVNEGSDGSFDLQNNQIVITFSKMLCQSMVANCKI